MSKNEDMEKNFQNTETTDNNKIDELDCDSLTNVAGGVSGSSSKIERVLRKSPVIVAYGHPGMIALKYGFPSNLPIIGKEKRLELEAKLKDPNLSPEERKRIEGLLKMYKSGGKSGESKQ